MRQILKLRPLMLALMATACSQGADIASPGATNGGTGSGGTVTPPTTTGTLSPGATANCPAGTTNGGILGVGNGELFGLSSGSRNITVCDITGTVLTPLTLPFLPGLLYRLNGRVDIGRDVGADGALSGGVAASLTIQPGVRVIGAAGTDVLIVNRGSTINAIGTSTNPIVFTSQLAVQTPRANIPLTAFRQWAGVIIAGRAPTRKCATAVAAESVLCQNEVEGITASTGRPAFYGGATPADNSGSLQFVQINYAGAFLPGGAAGDDLNGLSLAGVGSGTTVRNVQVNNSGDDGIEIFGGRVDMRNIIITGAFDDSYDCDEGYTGRTQFMIVVQRRYPAGSGGGPDGLVECSNAIGSAITASGVQTRPIIANFTFVGQEQSDTGGNLKGIGVDASAGAGPAAGIRLYNGVVWNNLGANGVAASTPRCFSVTNGDTGSGRGDGDTTAMDVRSVLFDCKSTGSANNTTASLNVINAGTNNSGPTSAQGTFVANTLAFPAAPGTSFFPADFPARIVNGATENARAAFNVNAIDPAFFTAANYIGAVQNNADTWWRGWSCGLEETSGTARTNTCQ